MNRGVVGAAAPPPSPFQEERQPPIDSVRVSSPSSSALASASTQPKFRRCQSTDACPSTMLQQSQPQCHGENAWVKKHQYGGKISRRNSMEKRSGNNTTAFARKNSRSTSPKFIPPIDSFGIPAVPGVAAEAVTKSKGGFSRRNSMTRSRSPKFVEPLASSDHDKSRVFMIRRRRHTLDAGPNPFTYHKLETLRENSTNESSMSDVLVNDAWSSDNIAEQLKQRLESLEGPSTPKVDAKNEHKTAPRKPFSRHNSIEGVDPSIFPSLPMLDKTDSSNDTDPNLDLALLFEHLVKDDEADDASSSDDDDNIIQRHMKSKIRRRCSTGGLRSFERENLRNFLEDTEGDDLVRKDSDSTEKRRGSIYRKCSTGGLRTLQRENSRDLYSDDCSLDGNKGKVHLSNDTAFEAYLRKMTQEADVDTSNDVNIIDHHVGGAVRRRSSIKSVSSFLDATATEDPDDFAQFLSRVGQGVVSGSQTVSTVDNTTYFDEGSFGSPREMDSSPFKGKLPHSIHMSSALDESVSSLENSNRQERPFISPLKDSAEVNFRSSKSRSIRRLASNDGIEQLRELAEGMEAPAPRRSNSGIRTPDPEEIALKDLPGLIKDIDRDLVTERAVYQQRRSSGSGPTPEEAAKADDRSASVHFSLKPLELPGTAAPCVSDEDDVPKPRMQQQADRMGDSLISTEFHSMYIAKGYIEPQKGEVPPLPMIVVQEAEVGVSAADMAKYQPKRRRSSTSTKSISEDRQRFGKQGKSFDEKRRKEIAKNSPFQNHNDGSSSVSEGIKSLRRKLLSGV
jgi:hypothetical protein